MVAESDDGRALLVGEAKWRERADAAAARSLALKAAQLPFVNGRKVHLALWTKHSAAGARDVARFGPAQVLAALG